MDHFDERKACVFESLDPVVFSLVPRVAFSLVPPVVFLFAPSGTSGTSVAAKDN